MSVDDEREILGEGGGGQMCGALVRVCRSSGVGLSCEVSDLFVVIFLVADDDASSSFAGWGWGVWGGIGGLFVRARHGHGGWLSWVVCARV